jgi:hypothetical protein
MYGITRSALARQGVELLDRGTLHLRCGLCGHEWRIAQGANTRRPNHWRECRRCHPRRRRSIYIVRSFNAPFHVLRQLRGVA